jgi:hypothetical protein
MTGSALAAGGYGAVAGEQSGGGNGAGSGAGLPFTGLALVEYAVVAGGIIAAGAALRVIAGRQSRL